MPNTKALADIRVLDLSRLLPGPMCTRLLADLGAQVTKLEDPKGGDYLRFMPPLASDGVNTIFHMLNAGKRSAVLDLKSEEGKDTFRQLALHYDVIVESFRPSVMSKLGLGPEAIRQHNPKIIWCSISGYGQTGPKAKEAGHDLNYLAESGVLGMTGPSSGPPAVPAAQIADISGALYATTAIVAAIRERDRTGEGQVIDISLCESAATFAAFGWGLSASPFASDHPLPGEGALMGGLATYRTYKTSDDRSVAFASLEPKFFKAFCEGVNADPSLPNLEMDPSALAVGPHQSTWTETLEAIFSTHSAAHWKQFAQSHECCLSVVLTPAEAQSNSQLQARGFFSKRKITNGKELPVFQTPLGASQKALAPSHGQHTEQVLKEIGVSSNS